MILNLLAMWKDLLLKKRRAHLLDKSAQPGDAIMQSSFTLPEDARIIFINDKNTLKPIKRYAELNEVILTESEKVVVAQGVIDLLKRPPPYDYDGDHILVSAVLYDFDEDIVYIEAKKTKYSLVTNLSTRKFPTDSAVLQQDFYSVGAVVPLLTQDGFSALLQSSKGDKTNYLTVAGYAQAKHDNTILNNDDGLTLIEQTASEELFEELLADKNLKSRLEFDRLQVSSISFKKGKEGRGYIDFVVPAKLHCKHELLAQVISSNIAPDQHEHTGNFRLFDLNSDMRHVDNYSGWAKQTPGGQHIYPVVISEASRLFNKSLYGDITQRFMPGSRGEAFPVTFFKPDIRLELPPKIQKSIDKNEKSRLARTDYIAIKYLIT